MSTPVVSVVVATYRREQELFEALSSLAAQTYAALEVIVVDDNGCPEWNERVAAIIARVRETFPSLSLQLIVNSPNQGSAKTRNIGIAATTGALVTFLDDDDVYEPRKIENQASAMLAADADYCITNLGLYNQHGKLIDKRERDYIKKTDVTSLTAYHLTHHMTGTDTMMFKRDYLVGIGGFDAIDVGDEFYLMQKAIAAGGKFLYAPFCDVKAIVHTGENEGVSSGEGKINGENALFAYKQKFFGDLEKSTVRYIKARHFAVIAFAELRRRHMMAFALNSLHGFFISPIAFAKIILKR